MVVNENDFAITLGLSPGAGARAGQPETLTLPARGFVVLPARGTTVSVGAATAGNATVIPLSVAMPFFAGQLGEAAGATVNTPSFTSIAGNGLAALIGGQTDALGPNLGLYVVGMQYVFNGATMDRQRTPVVFKPVNAVALGLGTDTTVWTPAAGKKFRLMGYVLAHSVAARLLVKDNTAGAVIAVESLQAGVRVASPPMGNGILSAVANNVLVVNASAAGTLDGFVFGTEE